MAIISLTEKDLHNITKNAVLSILKETTDEVRGSVMADKEDVIEAIVDYIRRYWENDAKYETPVDRSSFGITDIANNVGTSYTYVVEIPKDLTYKLGISDNFTIVAMIKNFVLPEKYLEYLGFSERATGGSSFGGDEYSDFKKTTLRFRNSKITLTTPAVNGELQEKGLYATLYHELNHSASMLNISRKANEKGYEDMIGNNMFSANRSNGLSRHSEIMSNLDQSDFFRAFGNQFRYGEDYNRFRAANFILYGLWETTELNARAEEIYGELQHAKISEDQFKDFYPKTSLYFYINQFGELLDDIMMARDDSEIWPYIAKMIKEKSPGRARKRFASRTNELIKKLYDRGMRIAKLYFDRHRQGNAPGA